MHGRAVERLAESDAEVRQLRATIRQHETTIVRLQQQSDQREAEIQEKDQQIEALKAKVAELVRQVFGRSTGATDDSRSSGDDATSNTTEPGSSVADDDPSSKKPDSDQPRGRGQKPGAQGHGRTRTVNLPIVEQVHEVPPDQRCCPQCGKPFQDFPGTEDSEEIEWEVILRRRVHKRRRYQATCDCKAAPGIVTAPVPAKLIPKGKFSVSFWVRLLLEKFLFQRPLYRTRRFLLLEGLAVSAGTLTGGFKQLGELLQPIYTRILERNRAANHWKIDETRWMVFEQVEGKTGYRWWLWVFITDDTVVYLLEPSCSSQVPRDHLGPAPEGIINADRYAVYTSLGDKIRVAFFWSHLRRDFDRVRTGYQSLVDWSDRWMQRINEVFHLNGARLEMRSTPQDFQAADQTLRAAVETMRQVSDRELGDPHLHRAARKVLRSMRERWSGYTIFVDHPEIPMDNNESERRLPNPVVGRKNYYGSGSQWSAMLIAILFSLFQTLLKNQIDPQKWLDAYFQACAENGGRVPEDLDAWLAWNLPADKKDAWFYPEHPP